ncbi:glycoside hydrolase domain-containing protein [Streptomyces angustmyceticus]|uniref:glycoside hydrolase domain-containing protein n=1 Tax=Streptomyces angustmyceticus TaxID=285578 RepID=UPI0021AE752C|nr:glycoside hydrolase domain-containing protein [Streptomyces angustmyceticus]
MADEQVLRAQKWVNSHYGSVAGYVRCPEDGRTGWGTMTSLVMALQHELGISPVMGSFGPTTYAKFAALGDIGFQWDKNRNLVSVLQYGLWCKGYWAVEPGSEGWFTGVTRDAVKKLRGNMGIGGEGVINAPITRALLNMDAYVVVAGGTDGIRSIQQWLNGRYWTRDAYNIGPCDGVYSRDVQKSLMIALQYELGIAAPTGNFGPGTQEGLRSHTLVPGDSGVFVQLFSAACVFNAPTYLPTGDPVLTTWRSTYDSGDSSLAEWVKLFQVFNKLPDNGKGDYATWAQLLVSMGDPDREAHGSDTRFEITPARAKWMRDNRYWFVGRYIYDPPGSTLDKEIKPGELETIFSNGLKVFPIYQDNARRLGDFSYSSGYQHGLNAHKRASAYGFNRGTTIYFAVDYDATGEEIQSAIVPYFHGVQAALASQGKKYTHGVYGSRNVCSTVSNATFARSSFVSGMSWGFSGNLGFPIPRNWAFNQIKEFKVTNGSDTFDLDRDVVSGIDPGVSSVNDTGGPADSFINYVQKLYDLAGSYGAGGQKRSQLVMEYIRHHEYGDKGLDNKVGWWYLIGSYDTGFVDYCNSKGMSIKGSFTDPFTGYQLGSPHMMATANAHLLRDQPGDKKAANGGDVGGWAGDLMTFWADWRNSEQSYANPWQFAHDRLAVPGVASSFGFTDLIEDADGYHLARAVRGNKSIVDALKDHYNGGGGLRRFNNYFNQRWGNATDCKTSAHNALTSLDKTLSAAQIYLITSSGAAQPADYQNLPGGSEKLSKFEQGFVDALLARMGMERRSLSQYRANHEKYLKAARARSAR